MKSISFYAGRHLHPTSRPTCWPLRTLISETTFPETSVMGSARGTISSFMASRICRGAFPTCKSHRLQRRLLWRTNRGRDRGIQPEHFLDDSIEQG